MKTLILILHLFLIIPFVVNAQNFLIEEITDPNNYPPNYSSKTSKYDSLQQVISKRVVKVSNPFLYQDTGKIHFTSNIQYLPNELLNSVSVKYSGTTDYKWRGFNYEKSFDLTIVRNSFGNSGTITRNNSDTLIRILPIDTIYSVLLEIDHVESYCDLDDLISSGGSAITDGCSNICPGHIDLLFLISPDAGIWLGSNPDSQFDVMISDLETSFENSNIPHTISYDYTYITWDLFTNDCFDDAESINSNTQIQNVMDAFGSDLAVLLAPPSQYLNSPSLNLACVAKIGPDSENPIAVVPVDICLTDHIFVHEVGHLLGGKHQWYPHAPDPQCAFAYNMASINKKTVMAQPPNRVLHFSDPEIEYVDGVVTGATNRNNAGRIRTIGCEVAAFNPSSGINPIITVSNNNCQLELVAYVENPNSNFTYDWYWNYSGIFSGLNPDTYLGTGDNIIISEPIGDPCQYYFIH